MGRAGNSGGGGGRSSGGGSFRSSGGRSGGSGAPHRSGFGSSGNSGRGGSSRPPGGFGGGSYRPGNFGAPFGFPGGRGGSGYGGGCGCSSTLISIIVVIGIALLMMPRSSPLNIYSIGQSIGNGGSYNVTKSTIQREKLPPGSVKETSYYTDELHWISNPTKLLTGMKNFYNRTGVQPYVYITNTIDGTHTPTDQQMDDFSNALYSKLFTDEAHFLVVFHEYNEEYKVWYVAGNQAKTVIDTEAANIFLDYIDKYYYSNMSEDEFFSKAFDDASTKMMVVTKSPLIPLGIALILLAIIVIAFVWWRKYVQQKNEEAAQTERILRTPLEKIPSPDDNIDDLAKKYENKE